MANNTVQALIPINGLFKRLNYTFEIEGLGGNWPARVSLLQENLQQLAKAEISVLLYHFVLLQEVVWETQTFYHMIWQKNAHLINLKYLHTLE